MFLTKVRSRQVLQPFTHHKGWLSTLSPKPEEPVNVSKWYGILLATTIGTSIAMEEDSESGALLARRNSMRKQKRYYPYVIVGAGTCALSAIEGIKQYEPNAEILLLSDEQQLPRIDADWKLEHDEPIHDELRDTYNEWRRHITSKLEAEPDAFSSSPVTLLLGRNDMHYDTENKRILLQDGTQVEYDKCLLANAGKPRNFYVLDSNRISYTLKDRINTCTSLSDFEQLDGLIKKATSGLNSDILNVTVIGGGFLGVEVAAVLATATKQKLNVQQVFVESLPVDRYLPQYLSQDIARRLKEKGVELISDRLVTGIKANTTNMEQPTEPQENTSISVSLLGNEKEKLSTDYVALCSTHIDPNIRLAQESCLEIDEKNGGIMVNAQLEAVAGMYVAGNLASYYDRSLGRRRVDMFDHAVNSGLAAGHNMVLSKTGKAKAYVHQPMFRSNMEGLGLLLQGVGEINSNCKTVGVWMNNKSKDGPSSYERGVIYYIRGNKIVGILLWNTSDLIESARQLLNKQPNIDDYNHLKHAISLGPDNWLNVIVADKK